MKRKTFNAFLGLFVFTASIALGIGEGIYIKPASREHLMQYPNPADFRNYFFLQSIEDSTSVIIGDFSGSTRLVIQINDETSSNKIDSIFEYYPETNKFKKMTKCSSQFFNENIAQLKKDIISGKLFRENYSFKMMSLDALTSMIDEGFNIFRSGNGYVVKHFDPDAPTSLMSEFYFSKHLGRYDLQFKTNYYKIFNMKIVPPIPYSVYCKNSKDPVVAEVVESLLKEMAKRK